MYKYQMHIHTTPCSQCGLMTPQELCQALKEYGGILVESRIRTEEDLAKILKSKEYDLILPE